MRFTSVLPFLAVAAIALNTIGASGAALRVRDANFLGNPDRIVIDMVNDGTKTVAGFYLDVTVTRDGAVVRRFGYKNDLLGRVMFDWEVRGTAYSWASAVSPHASHQELLSEDLAGARPTGSNVAVQVTVEAVLYIDGSIEGSGNSEAVLEMQQLFETIEAMVQADGELNSIFQAHAKDPNARRRLVAILAEVDGLPQQREGILMHFVEARRNLHNMLLSPHARMEIDAYTALVDRRHALMVAAMNGQTSEGPTR
jgi:hypothetical protein